jgi:hypothetical protein
VWTWRRLWPLLAQQLWLCLRDRFANVAQVVPQAATTNAIDLMTSIFNGSARSDSRNEGSFP